MGESSKSHKKTGTGRLTTAFFLAATVLLASGQASAFRNYQEFSADCIARGGIPAMGARCLPRSSSTSPTTNSGSSEEGRRDRARAALSRGNEEYRNKSYDEALRSFQLADEIFSTDASRHNIELTLEAIRANRARAAFTEALAAHRNGYYEQAVSLWNSVLDLEPDNEAAKANKALSLSGRADARAQEQLSRDLPAVLDRVLGTGSALRQAQTALLSLLLTDDARCPYDSSNGCIGFARLPTAPTTPPSTNAGFSFAETSRENQEMKTMRAQIMASRDREKDIRTRLRGETDPIKKISLEKQLTRIDEETQQKQRNYELESERVNRGIK
jgi:tetratricopeptide (TPR) repeat protein